MDIMTTRQICKKYNYSMHVLCEAINGDDRDREEEYIKNHDEFANAKWKRIK